MAETTAALRRAILNVAEAYDEEEGMPLRAGFIAKLARDADRPQRAEELPERWRKYAQEMRELGGPVKEAEAHKCEAIAAELEATLGCHHDD